MGSGLRNSFWVVASVLFLAVAAAFPTGASMAATANGYNGSLGHPVEEEWALESETRRRILQDPKYITYHVTRSNMPLGNARSGLSYRRGCKSVYDCRNKFQ
ncbi:putative protein RALF-like 33 [Cocos nucifera]|uniref:Uncharacterized protein n=1 Tax=Cocos nucifera TaxID=13894 RepID=A0A8K0N463_COCNU|nr:putative protein RALF-like 33 [Cocos nucifera]